MRNSILTTISVTLFLSAHVLPAAFKVKQETKTSVLESIIRHLETDYVDKEVGLFAAGKLSVDLETGRFQSLEDGEAFANSLSHRIQELTGDGHFNVEYHSTPMPETKEASEEHSAEQMERWYGSHLNFGVERVERLADNVGYLDLRFFAPIDMGAETVAAALNVVSHTDALIIDLRRNGGGMGDMADFVASYLFGPERKALTGTYDRPSNRTTQRFTQPYVPGNRFGPDKPVYILISEKTFSAAEALAYNLQALKRATIVGETSGGGAHPFNYLRIHPHFVLWSVTARSINPITGENWQGVGVLPDIEVEASEALSAALADLDKRKR